MKNKDLEVLTKVTEFECYKCDGKGIVKNIKCKTCSGSGIWVEKHYTYIYNGIAFDIDSLK